MRCFSCNFYDEDELESLLVVLWVWLEEKKQTETPEMEIRRGLGTAGRLLIWLKDEPHLSPPMHRSAPSHWAPMLGYRDRREATAHRSPSANDCAAVGQRQRYGASATAGGGRLNVHNRRGRFRP
jgi:hypothetical protein